MYKRVIKILELYSKNESLSKTNAKSMLRSSSSDLEDDFCFLLDSGYLHVDLEYSIFNKIDSTSSVPSAAPLSITTLGRNILSDERRRKRNYIFNEIRAWITLAISIIALIVSITE